MAEILIGCGQITWGQFAQPGGDREAYERQTLSEIAQAGYAGAPAGPGGGRTPEQAAELFASFGLKPAPGYLGVEFWRPEQHEQILAQAREQAQFAQALGLTELYVASGGFTSYTAASGRTRAAAAGHVRPDDGMSEQEWQQFVATLNAVGAITLERGVRSCFHNHVGSVIESEAEIERLLALVDPQVIFLGPDTGHLEWAGVDAAAFCKRHANRIHTIHVKDIDASVRAHGREAGWDYGTFARNGVFTELGQGCVDFPTIFADLQRAGFGGWVIAETDVTQRPSALESATISREYLRSVLG